MGKTALGIEGNKHNSNLKTVTGYVDAWKSDIAATEKATKVVVAGGKTTRGQWNTVKETQSLDAKVPTKKAASKDPKMKAAIEFDEETNKFPKAKKASAKSSKKAAAKAPKTDKAAVLKLTAMAKGSAVKGKKSTAKKPAAKKSKTDKAAVMKLTAMAKKNIATGKKNGKAMRKAEKSAVKGKKSAAKKPAAKKGKKVATRKLAARKSAAKKPAAKKSAAKKPAAKKPAAKKPAAKKSAAKKSAAKKPVAKKPVAKKPTAVRRLQQKTGKTLESVNKQYRSQVDELEKNVNTVIVKLVQVWKAADKDDKDAAALQAKQNATAAELKTFLKHILEYIKWTQKTMANYAKLFRVKPDNVFKSKASALVKKIKAAL